MIEGADGDWATTNQAINDIKTWCEEFNIAIILCHHCTKNATRTDVANAAGSYKFNSVCDNAMGLEADFEEETATVKTFKIRYNNVNGKAYRECHLAFDINSYKYYDPEQQQQAEDNPFYGADISDAEYVDVIDVEAEDVTYEDVTYKAHSAHHESLVPLPTPPSKAKATAA